MKTTEQELIDHIQKFYGDTSRSRAQTREGLENASEMIDTLIDTLQDDEE